MSSNQTQKSTGSSVANSSNQGNRNNMPWQWRMLQALGDLTAISTPPAGGLATEATAVNILNAIMTSHQDIEILLVRDTVTGIVYQQVIDYQSGVPVYSYKDVNGAPFVPVNPMVYLDPSAVLNLMLTEMLDQGLTLDTIETNTDQLEALLTTIDTVLDNIKLDTANLDVALSTRASEATLLATNGLLTTIDAVLDTIKTDTTAIAGDTAAMAVDLAAIEVLITTTNSLLTTIDTVLDAIKGDTADIVTATQAIETLLTGQSRTPSVVTAVADGSTVAGKKGVSLWFRGNGGTLDGEAVPNGARFTFSADDNNDTVASIAYTVPTGGAQEIIITYLT